MVQSEVGTTQPRARGKQALEVGLVHKAFEHGVVAWGGCASRQWRAGPKAPSDRQALAAFGAAGVQHGAATTGLHAHEETVRTGAADLGGLVGALHGKLGLKGLFMAATADSESTKDRALSLAPRG